MAPTVASNGKHGSCP